MSTAAANTDRSAYYGVSEISKLLGIVVTADRLADLGIKPDLAQGVGKYFARTRLPEIGQTLAGDIVKRASEACTQ